MIEAAITVIGGGLLAMLGWGMHMSNRVSVLEADKVSLKELLNVQLKVINERLARIEKKLDQESE